MGIEYIAQIGTALGGAAGATGSVMQGFAAKQQAEYNASVAEAHAAAARAQAALDESTSRKKSAMLLGTIRARAAANTGEVSGSALDVLADSAAEAELEALTLRYQGEVRARAMESEAAIERKRGKSAVLEGFVGAGTRLLTAGNYAMKAYGGSDGGSSAIPALSTRVPYLSSSGRKIGPV